MNAPIVQFTQNNSKTNLSFFLYLSVSGFRRVQGMFGLRCALNEIVLNL